MQTLSEAFAAISDPAQPGALRPAFVDPADFADIDRLDFEGAAEILRSITVPNTVRQSNNRAPGSSRLWQAEPVCILETLACVDDDARRDALVCLNVVGNRPGLREEALW